MIESIVTKYKEAIDEWNSLIAAHDDVPNDDEIFNIESSLKKIEIFYSCHDLGKYFILGIVFCDCKIILIFKKKLFKIFFCRQMGIVGYAV